MTLEEATDILKTFKPGESREFTSARVTVHRKRNTYHVTNGERVLCEGDLATVGKWLARRVNHGLGTPDKWMARRMTKDVKRCAYCGGPFHRSHRSHSEFAKSRCCSRSCARKLQGREYREARKKNPKQKEQPATTAPVFSEPDKQCECCGKLIPKIRESGRAKSVSEYQSSRFCRRACQRKWSKQKKKFGHRDAVNIVEKRDPTPEEIYALAEQLRARRGKSNGKLSEPRATPWEVQEVSVDSLRWAME